MRLIKGFLVVSTALFIIITLLSLLIPSVVKVSRTVLIRGTNKEVYEAVADLKQWHNWHPALGVEGTVLSYCDDPIAYTSKCCNVTYNEKLPPVQNKSVDTTSNKPGGYDGKTIHLQITSADSSSIKFIIEAKGENTIQNEIHITPIKEQGQLQVDWHTITKLHWYPWEKFYAIFMDKLTGPGYEAALEGLKNEVEKESLHP